MNLLINIIFFFIFVILLLINLTNNSNSNLKKCKWKIYRDNSYNLSMNSNIKLFINLLNEIKIHYFLGFGSELGAVRDGGYIKGDNDFDIIVPIWKNYWLFKCDEVAVFPIIKCWVRSSPNVKICNKTKYEYMKILKNYVIKNIKRYVYFRIYSKMNCWVMKNNDSMIDMWLTMGNEYSNNDDFCRCKFSNIITYCNLGAEKRVKVIYGNEWFIPKQEKEKCMPLILNPTKINVKMNYNNVHYILTSLLIILILVHSINY